MADYTLRFNQGAMRSLLKTPDGAVGKDIRRRGQAVVRRAKALAPKGATLQLSGGIHMEGPSLEGGELQAEIVSDADYSIHVEKGTRNMRAQPFLGPALAEASS